MTFFLFWSIIHRIIITIFSNILALIRHAFDISNCVMRNKQQIIFSERLIQLIDTDFDFLHFFC